MNNGKKSAKMLFVVTALTILALSAVIVTAAVLLGTINGGTVTVGGVAEGTIYYSLDNSTGWTTPLSVSAGSWYAELTLNAGYAGPVTITWQLQSDASGSWTAVSGATVTSTGIILTGSGQTVYASSSGAQASNLDWSTYATGAGAYRVTAVVNSAS